MRRPFFLIFTNAMILIVIFTMLAQSLFIVQRVAVTEELNGRVEVQRGGRGEFRAVSKGSLVKLNDVLRADKDGMAEFKWLDGTRLKITPGTQLVIKKVSHNAAKKVERSEFRLDQGKVFIRMVKALTPASLFEVETPTAVAAVRGTIFSVEVVDGKTRVAVYKGKVNVSSRSGDLNQEKVIHAGEVAVSEKAGRIDTAPSDLADPGFERHTSIIRPELTASIERLQESGQALLRGRTEAGNVVAVNGRRVRVRGDGGFLHRVAVQPGLNTYTIVTTDRHGATATVTQTLNR